MCPELIACAIALSSTTEPLEVLIIKQFFFIFKIFSKLIKW